MKCELTEAVQRGFVPGTGTPRAVLVVGDLMLDRYLWGEVVRISPEAPVPIVRLTRETDRVGGAGNVAANLVGLGVETIVAGPVGVDAEGARLGALLTEAGIDTSGLVECADSPTVCKIRVIGGHQQMLRIDRERPVQSSPASEQALTVRVLDLIERRQPAAVVLSDYAKGALTAPICRAIIDSSRALGIPVLIDPKGRDISKYRGATTLTPNLQELSAMCGVLSTDTEGMLAAGEQLVRELDLDFLALTRGEAGISLLRPGQPPLHLPVTARQVFDVSGAGDTVIATLAAGLVSGLQPAESLELANFAAGVVVGKVGTTPISRTELLLELERREVVEQADKICELNQLLFRVAEWRQKGVRIVFTNGCFDLLHAGHVTYLEKARRFGDRLVVGLNTDRSVRVLKGESRPVIHEVDRARVLAALAAVDAVILFDSETPLELIRSIRPDVLVKGDDYREDQVVGGDEVKNWGGHVALVPVVPGRSSSKIISLLGNDHQ